MRWYQERYGDRLKRRMDLGRFVLGLRGSAWLAHVPVFFGRVQFVIERPIDPSRRQGGARCNVLDQIDDLSDALRGALTDDELAAIWRAFKLALDAYVETGHATFSELVIAALSDHDAAIAHMVGQSKHYGQAKWSALQAAEKSIKALIIERGGNPPRHHNLRKLAAGTAISHQLAPQLLALVQCDADIRYGPSRTPLDEAIAAHHGSLEISRICALELRRMREERARLAT
jgi:HEPN domain-containing protein